MKRAIPSMLFGLVLAIAAQTLWGLAASWAEEIRMSLTPRERKYESLEILNDGTPVVTMVTYSAGASKQSNRTLAGRLLADSEESSVSQSGTWLIPGRTESGRVFRKNFRLDWGNRVHGFYLQDIGVGESWYAVSDPDGSTQFVGFDMQSKRIVGYFGRSGFRDTPPPLDDQFSLTPEYVSSSPTFAGMGNRNIEPSRYGATLPPLLPLPKEVVEIDLAKRKIATVWRGAGAVDASMLVRLPFPSKNKPHTVVRTGTRLHVLGADFEEKYSVEIPEDFRDKILKVYEPMANGLTVLPDERYASVAYIAHLRADGPPEIQAVPLDNSKPDDRLTWPLVALAVPQPAGLVGVLFIKSHERPAGRRGPSWSESLGEEWPRFWPTLLAVAVLSALLAVAALRRQRRFGLGYGYLWAAFVFVCGVPGWFAYRWHRAWPPLEACPKCGAMAPRDRETCFRCGTPFPPPRRESFEIRD